DLEQHLARDAQPLLHVAALVHLGVVDEPLPSDGRAGLLEVDPHHDEQPVGEPRSELHQPPRVIQRGDRIVNRAGPDDTQQARVAAADDVANLGARVDYALRDGLAGRELLFEQPRRDQRLGRDNVKVLNLAHRRGTLGRTSILAGASICIANPRGNEAGRWTKRARARRVWTSSRISGINNNGKSFSLENLPNRSIFVCQLASSAIALTFAPSGHRSLKTE